MLEKEQQLAPALGLQHRMDGQYLRQLEWISETPVTLQMWRTLSGLIPPAAMTIIRPSAWSTSCII